MKTKLLQGTERRLYDFVAPLVLNPVVIKQNGGVAFKTSEKHVWILAVSDDDSCIGFLPVQKKKDKGEINNYYIRNRDEKVLTLLLQQALKYAEEQAMDALEIIAQTEDYDPVESIGFLPVKKYVNYTRFKKEL